MNKNKYFLLLLLLVFSCQEPQRNCKDFKTGKFSFSQTINGKKAISTFKRLDKIQIETFNQKIDTVSIRWINDCEYIIQKIKPKNLLEKKALHFKILTTTQNSYTFEYSYIGSSEKNKGTVVKL